VTSQAAPKSSGARPDVCVVGELNPDLILYGIPRDPKPDHEYLVDGFRLTLGSSSAIFAHNLAALGTSVAMVSKVGADALGEMCLGWLRSAAVDTSHIVRSEKNIATGLSVILAHPGHRFILTYPGTIFDLAYEDLNLDFVFSARHLHVASFYLNRALRPRMAELFREAKRRGLSTSLDTNDDPEGKWAGDLLDVLPHVDVFFPNEREAKFIARTDNVAEAIDALAAKVRMVVVKLGPKGALAREGSEEWRCKPIAVNALDTVGAGDSFDAGYIHKFLGGAAPQACLDYANLTGAFSTTHEGGTEAFRNRDAMTRFLAEHSAAR
jgi:sugar/nucleoside kinase (ribokinase family)